LWKLVGVVPGWLETKLAFFVDEPVQVWLVPAS